METSHAADTAHAAKLIDLFRAAVEAASGAGDGDEVDRLDATSDFVLELEAAFRAKLADAAGDDGEAVFVMEVVRQLAIEVGDDWAGRNVPFLRALGVPLPENWRPVPSEADRASPAPRVAACGRLPRSHPAGHRRSPVSVPDFWNMIAIDRGMPEGWRWYSVKVLGDPTTPREHAAALVKGGVPGARFKSGKHKGEINWAKATGKAEIVITFRDFDARAARWEAETGKCKQCGGDGQEFAGWSATDGTSTRPCTRCKATGKAPPQ